MTRLAGYAIVFAGMLAQAQPAPPTAEQSLKRNFEYVNGKILEMAQDFPADKYNFKLKPEMRSFGEVIVHIADGNIYAGKFDKDQSVKWDEQDPKKFATKDAVVAMFKKSFDDAKAAMAAHPMGPRNNLQPFLSVMQHSSEHYGLLVAYYRANGLVPPESRPKPKK